MANLLTKLRDEILRYTLGDYVRQLTSGPNGLMGPMYPPAVTYSQGMVTERTENSFAGYIYGGMKVNPIVFGCMLARSSVFSEARFVWRKKAYGQRPGDIFVNGDLDLLATPWPNGHTGDLLNRMIQDVDLAGNCYLVNEGDRVRRLRPDWVQIVLSGNPLTEPEVDIVGYVYNPGGVGHGEPVPYGIDEVCHWAPIPDPDAMFRGMSWLTPVVREIQADIAATDHKVSFFRNGATLGPIVKAPEGMSIEKFKEFVRASEDAHRGPDKAYATMYLAGGSDVTLSTANMQQMDFKVTQGAGETRICVAARVPAVIAGVSEGLQGSSLNAGNYQAAKKSFVDGTMRGIWRSACDSLSTILTVPKASELWIDECAIAYLRDDETAIATIQQTQMSTIVAGIQGGFEPDSVVIAVNPAWDGVLKHSGLMSVQLTPPGQDNGGGADVTSGQDNGGDTYGQDAAGTDTGATDGQAQRAFNRNQLRGPHGRWINMGAMRRIGAEVAKAFKDSHTTVDWRGIHVTAPVRGRDVTVTVSPLDIASIALLAVPGPDLPAAAYEAARAAQVVRQIRKALAAAKAAETVAKSVEAHRRNTRPHVRRAFNADEPRDDHGRWSLIGAAIHAVHELMSDADIADQYGNEIDRYAFMPGNEGIVAAHDTGDVTVQFPSTDGGAEVAFHADPDAARKLADRIDKMVRASENYDPEDGTPPSPNGLVDWTVEDDILVGHDESGDIIVRTGVADDDTNADHDISGYEGYDLGVTEADNLAFGLRNAADDAEAGPADPTGVGVAFVPSSRSVILSDHDNGVHMEIPHADMAAIVAAADEMTAAGLPTSEQHFTERELDGYNVTLNQFGEVGIYSDADEEEVDFPASSWAHYRTSIDSFLAHWATDDTSRSSLDDLNDDIADLLRAEWDPAKHPRNLKGSPGGGRFRSLVDRIVDALTEWEGNGRRGDPLAAFSRPQLRRVATARGVEVPHRAPLAVLKAAILDHVSGVLPAEHAVTGPPSPPTTRKTAAQLRVGDRIHLRKPNHADPTQNPIVEITKITRDGWAVHMTVEPGGPMHYVSANALYHVVDQAGAAAPTAAPVKAAKAAVPRKPLADDVAVSRALKMLQSAKPATIDPHQVDALMREFKLTDPNSPFNMSRLQITGPGNELLFRRHLRNRPRDTMPQLPTGFGAEGTTSAGKTMEEFEQYLQDKGVKFEYGMMDPRELIASQSELNAYKVSKLYGFMRDGGWLPSGVMIVARNGGNGWAVVDGHHRWAGASAASIARGGTLDVQVMYVDADIDEVLGTPDNPNGIVMDFATFEGLGADRTV